MDVEEYISKAWSAVSKAKVPSELQELAFREALDFLRKAPPNPTNNSTATDSGASSKNKADQVPPNASSESTDVDEALKKLAHESGADLENLRHLFSFEGSQFHIRTPARQLGNSKRERNLRIATLLVPATVMLTGKSEVPAEIVRNECKSKNCLDSPNFAKNMGDMKHMTFGGTGGKRDFILGAKWEQAFCTAVLATINPSISSADEA
jgi:hypothetical protein